MRELLKLKVEDTEYPKPLTTEYPRFQKLVLGLISNFVPGL